MVILLFRRFFRSLTRHEMDDFKEMFKYYKQKHETKQLDDVINFDAQNPSESIILLNEFTGSDENNYCPMCIQCGLLPHQQWKIHAIKNLNGFFFIKNPFTVKGQQHWIRKSLELYPRKPSITNLDLHYESVDGIWGSTDPVKRKLIHKLCWATLGYHYNWDTKVYDPMRHSPFPACLAELTGHIASSLHFRTFRPEAAIVNYYNSKSCLGIHNDHSEIELNEPIISISFGQTAIFLVGTEIRTDKPIATFLRSGDIVVLSGQSRLSYHAVPTIVEELGVDSRFCGEDDDDTWRDFCNYISTHRINISTRQVYPERVVL